MNHSAAAMSALFLSGKGYLHLLGLHPHCGNGHSDIKFEHKTMGPLRILRKMRLNLENKTYTSRHKWTTVTLER